MTNSTIKSPVDLEGASEVIALNFAKNLVAVLVESRSQLIAQEAMLRNTIVDADSAYWLRVNDQYLESWDFPLADITLEQAIKRAALDSEFLALAGYAELAIESREKRDIAASDLLKRCDAELQREEAMKEAERIRKRLEKNAAKMTKQKS